MAYPLWVLTRETLLLLRRDKVMFPVLLAAVGVGTIANIASDWSVEDFTKILYDIGYFGFQLTGSLVAIFWGAKVLTDSRQDGAVEVQLAAPITRATWILAKYCGLSLCLIGVGSIFVVIWQGMMLINDFGMISLRQLILFALMIISWLVVSALSLMIASATRQTTAIFATLALWLCGLASSTVANTLSQETPRLTKNIVGLIVRIWNLQLFNFIDNINETVPIDFYDLALRSSYGIILIFLFITGACIIFRHRDMTPVA